MQLHSSTVAALLLGIVLPASADPGTSGNIPDLTGGWSRIGKLVETYERIPGSTGPGPLLVDPEHPHNDGDGPLQWVPSLDTSILKPETMAKLSRIRDAEIAGIPHVKDEGMCQPSGVPMLLNRRGAAVQILQTADRVIFMNARDHQVRFIYLDVPHSGNPGHSWYGESIGHYEGGDTLVVDTIGQNDRTQIDRFGTPHSDRIHVIERYRVAPGHQALEVQFTVEDPGAFTAPWSGRVRFAAARQPWEEEVCAENNRFIGQVTISGKVTTAVPIPAASHPDF